jgi:hypothetical protein
MPKPDETEDAFQQLDAALQNLRVCSQRLQSLLPHNDVMMSAQAFHVLDGEREVFEELDDEAIDFQGHSRRGIPLCKYPPSETFPTVRCP